MDDRHTAMKLFLMLLLVAALVYVQVLLYGRIPLLGKLPGDIVINYPGAVLYIPIVSSIIVSGLLILLAYLAQRISNDNNYSHKD
jgi:hypothetical protein